MTPVDQVERANDRLEALRSEQEWFDHITEPLMRKSPVSTSPPSSPTPPPPPPPPPPALEDEEADDYFGSAVLADPDSNDDSGVFKFEMND